MLTDHANVGLVQVLLASLLVAELWQTVVVVAVAVDCRRHTASVVLKAQSTAVSVILRH